MIYQDLANTTEDNTPSGPPDWLLPAATAYLRAHLNRFLGVIVAPLVASDDQSTYLVWPRDEDLINLIGKDLTTWEPEYYMTVRTPEPVRLDLAARALMRASTVRDTALRDAASHYLAASPNYPLVYAFKDGYIVSMTINRFPLAHWLFSGISDMDPDKPIGLWANLPVIHMYQGNRS